MKRRSRLAITCMSTFRNVLRYSSRSADGEVPWYPLPTCVFVVSVSTLRSLDAVPASLVAVPSFVVMLSPWVRVVVSVPACAVVVVSVPVLALVSVSVPVCAWVAVSVPQFVTSVVVKSEPPVVTSVMPPKSVRPAVFPSRSV